MKKQNKWDKKCQYNAKSKQKILVHFVLATHRNEGCHKGWFIYPIEKNYFPFCSSYHLQKPSCLGMGFPVHTHFYVLGFWIVWTYKDHMTAATVCVSSYVYQPCWFGITHFPWHCPPPKPLLIFLLPILDTLMWLQRLSVIKTPHLWLSSSKISHCLHNILFWFLPSTTRKFSYEGQAILTVDIPICH